MDETARDSQVPSSLFVIFVICGVRFDVSGRVVDGIVVMNTSSVGRTGEQCRTPQIHVDADFHFGFGFTVLLEYDKAYRFRVEVRLA